MKAIRLKTEYLKDPIGIGMGNPRLSWNCENGIRQTAYEIVATDDQGNILWQSEKVVSNFMHCVWDGNTILHT